MAEIYRIYLVPLTFWAQLFKALVNDKLVQYKIYSHFFAANNIIVFAIFHDRNFNITIANNFVKFEQLDPVLLSIMSLFRQKFQFHNRTE